MDKPTLNRIFTLHFVFPFLILGIIVLHFINLHNKGSSNPVGIGVKHRKITFYPYFTSKDIIGFLFLFIILVFLIYYLPLLLLDPDNFMLANSIRTPKHIQPE